MQVIALHGWKVTHYCLRCRIRKVAQGSAVFELRPEEEYAGKVVARAVPPNRGYNSAGESGLVAFEEAGMKQQLPYGAADLQVTLMSMPRLPHVCIGQHTVMHMIKMLYMACSQQLKSRSKAVALSKM